MANYFIQQSGNKQVIIGGVRQLTEFNDEQVNVRVKGGQVQISGERLEIERFDENEIIVRGKIDGVNTEK